MSGSGKIERLTDRELLVQQHTNLANMCRDVKDIKAANSLDHVTIFNKLDTVSDNKVSYKLFFWLVGILFICLLSLTSFVGSLSTKVTTNTTNIQHSDY
ncbi:MAG: hypothetical protein PF440_12115 [Thiomicrorhabdus sp.]|jgi:hypothetical protein|nr:hypothetical protein [Thiomicrorhabdus sp.]